MLHLPWERYTYLLIDAKSPYLIVALKLIYKDYWTKDGSYITFTVKYFEFTLLEYKGLRDVAVTLR